MTNWEKERWSYEEAKLFSQASISCGHIQDVDQPPDGWKLWTNYSSYSVIGWRCERCENQSRLGWIWLVETHGRLHGWFLFFFFLLCADGGNASSGVILIAPEAESQCFLLQQRLKSTPTDLWREGARLLLQLGPSQSDWRVQQNTRKHTPVCTAANSSTSLLSLCTYLMNSFLFFLYRFLPLSKVERSLGRRNFDLTKTKTLWKLV